MPATHDPYQPNHTNDARVILPIEAVSHNRLGQTHLSSQDLEQVGVIPGGFEAFGFGAAASSLFPLEQILCLAPSQSFGLKKEAPSS
jgi:hypothetical protein